MISSFENEIKSEFLTMSRQMVELLSETCSKLPENQEDVDVFRNRIGKLRRAALAAGYYEYTTIVDEFRQLLEKTGDNIQDEIVSALNFIFNYMLEINEEFSKDLSTHIDVRPKIKEFREMTKIDY